MIACARPFVPANDEQRLWDYYLLSHRRLKSFHTWLNENKVSRGETICLSHRRRFDASYRWCSRLANASDAAPATTSSLFRPLPFGHADLWIRLPAWCFLLVFYSNYNPPNMHRFELGAWNRQMDGRTDRNTVLNAQYIKWRTITQFLCFRVCDVAQDTIQCTEK